MIVGIGTDIIQNNRVKLSIAKRILTEAEYAVFENKHDDLKVEYLASRFAAKEAIVKATNKQFSINQIEILNDSDGRPYCNNIDGVQVTISHEKEYSVAFAIYEKETS